MRPVIGRQSWFSLLVERTCEAVVLYEKLALAFFIAKRHVVEASLARQVVRRIECVYCLGERIEPVHFEMLAKPAPADVLAALAADVNNDKRRLKVAVFDDPARQPRIRVIE